MLRSNLLSIVVAVLLIGHASPALAVDEAPARPLQANLVAADVKWEGPQYVGADGKGRIYLLRASDGLKVYPLEKNGEVGEPQTLQTDPVSGPAPVLEAAMDRHGNWLVVYGHEARLFRSGKERHLPLLRWLVSSVALLDGEPIVATFPLPVGRINKREIANPPLLLSADEDRWNVLAEAGIDGPPDLSKHFELTQSFASRLMADSRDTLWLAHLYRYRFSHFSNAGRELLTVEINGGRVKHRDEGEMEAAREELDKERARYSRPETATIAMNTAVTAILDLAEGRDGRIYLLTQGGAKGGLTLDRFDPVQAILERALVGATTPGAVSMAAGRDGIYLVPFNGQESRYLITWEEIDAGDWRPVEGVEINGQGASRS